MQVQLRWRDDGAGNLSPADSSGSGVRRVRAGAKLGRDVPRMT